MLRNRENYLRAIAEEVKFTREQKQLEDDSDNFYRNHKSTMDVMLEIEEGNRVNPVGWKGLPPITWAKTEEDLDDKIEKWIGRICGTVMVVCFILCLVASLSYPYIH